jgi:hypothetical protein
MSRANSVHFAMDVGRGDRTAEVAFRLEDGRIRILDVHSYSRTIDLPRLGAGVFGDRESANASG